MTHLAGAGTCRLCGAPLEHVFADLGLSPIANSYVPPERRSEMEPFYPLRALVCGSCLLVQLEQFETPEAIFSDYAYFSSYSTTWLDHSRRYAEMAVDRFALDEGTRVVELASNDGYLLQYFQERRIPVLGIEPAANVAQAALAKGIPTLVEFFGVEVARGLERSSRADLLIGNNVLAHVPDLHDFVGGMKLLLEPGGTITMEFPHLLSLIAERQFDTIYHEHFSYFSLLTVRQVFARHGLRIFDLDELPTHGGSIRIYAAHEDDPRGDTESLADFERRERAFGLDRLETYLAHAGSVAEEKRQILSVLIEQKSAGKTIVGYGAPAKGNTLLNYCGIGTDFVDFTVDLNPEKQGTYLPGSRIPVREPEAIREARPDLLFILPWNIKEEIMEQQSHVRDWGGKFMARSPQLRVFE